MRIHARRQSPLRRQASPALAGQRAKPRADADNLGAGSGAGATTHFAHDFSAVPAHAGTAEPHAGRIVREVLDSPGQPLEPAARDFMERRFGRDFGGVRVHTGARAAESADALDASAYTLGRHVVFGAGRYAPRETEGGLRIAHELAHVVQQDFRAAPAPRLGARGDAAEAEASDAARAAVYGGRMPPLRGGRGGLIQRDGPRNPQPAQQAGTPSYTPAAVTKRQAQTGIITNTAGRISEQDWESKKKEAADLKANLYARNNAGADRGDPQAMKQRADVLYREMYTEVAALAQADKLSYAYGVKTQGINVNVVESESKLTTGLNFNYTLDSGGRTSFLDAKGVNHQSKLPVTPTGLPSVAIQLGPKTFAATKGTALSTLRHEMMHAEHNVASTGWLKKWQDATGGKVAAGEAEKKFKEWMAGQKVSQLERDLNAENVEGQTGNSELLAYTEGFMTTYHLEPVLKDDEIAAGGGTRSGALLELLEVGNRWSAAGKAAKEEALGRIRQYYCDVLDKPRRDALFKWVVKKIERGTVTPNMSDVDRANANAAARAVPFLKNLQQIQAAGCAKAAPKP